MKRSARVEMPILLLVVALVLVTAALGITFPGSVLGEVLDKITFGLLP